MWAQFRWSGSCWLAVLFAVVQIVLAQYGNLQSDKMQLYGALVEKMVRHAQMAARLRNQGNIEGSEKSVTLVVETFERAKAALPDRHEAYLNIATFFFNSQQFDKSIEMWEKGRQLIEQNKQTNE